MIGRSLSGLRQPSEATTQSYLDRITGREFDRAEGAGLEQRAALGLTGASGDLEGKAVTTQARGEAMAGNYLTAQNQGLQSRLSTVRLLQGLTDVGPRIGEGQLRQNEIAAGENADLFGVLGGAAGLAAGGLMEDDYLSKLLKRRGGGRGRPRGSIVPRGTAQSGPLGFIPPVIG